MKKRAFGQIPVQMTLLLILIVTGRAEATDEIGAQEETDCALCHLDPEQGAETLTDQGLYYQYMKTLDGYGQVLERFDRCTYCHVDRAGDQALTPQGHRFRWMMDDMAGLRAWLEENHPRPENDEGGEDSSDD